MKGGYKIKDGFYIKDDCKNSVEEGMVDEEGFILDPILFDKIPKNKLLQLSDGYCYDKSNSQQLLTVINRSNRLPFGHDVKSVDRRELNIKKPKLKKKLLILESSDISSLPLISSTPTPSAVLEEPVVVESPAEEFEIIPRRRNRTRRRLPENVIIASDTTEVIDPPIQTLVAQENQNSPVRSLNNLNSEELADLYLTNEEEFYRRLNSARGIKRKTKKHKNRRGKKSKTKSRKYRKYNK